MAKPRLAIIGYGKMGQLVEKLALEKGFKVNAIIDPSANAVGKKIEKEITAAALKDVDVCIEFSSANAVVENVKKIAALGKGHVLATTGWYDKLDEVKSAIKRSNSGFIYATNFSIGVNVFFRLVEDAAKIINNIQDYDVFGYELHHNRKADSPSGTAKTIAELIVSSVDRKKKIVYDKIDRKIAADELHFASVRGGDVPGTHIINFDSTADTIELKHTAKTREGFALGSIMAAEWIANKKGFFEIKDMMKDVVK